MKSIFYLIIILCGCNLWNSLYAQDFQGVVKQDSGYISVPVSGLNTWEKIAAQWGVSPERLRTANAAKQADTLVGNTELLIPLWGILRSENCDSCHAVYHEVGQSQGLFRIGRWYGNLSVSHLKQLNNLRSDALQPGQELLVGYVAMDPSAKWEMLSEKAEPVAEQRQFEVAKSIPDTVPTGDSSVGPAVTVTPPRELVYQGAGFFESEWKPVSQVSVKTGKSAIFKSESGWVDGRFYLLSSYLLNGTIVKITHEPSGKTVFAKVVGPLPVIKQNDGLQMRISSAAAAGLGIRDEESTFDLKLEY